MLNLRFRRLRKSFNVRQILRETVLNPDQLIQPFFVVDGKSQSQIIDSMPGIKRFSIDFLLKEVESYLKLGGKAGLFFGISSNKDFKGSFAIKETSLIPQAVRAIKKQFPEFVVMTDVCLCAYLKHGHCGILSGHHIDNDQTLPVLAKMALAHARAGADFVAPSDMMDMRVATIREALDQNDLKEVGILSYAVKYASSFYGPFREAANSSPEFGDRKTYQMDYSNSREALREAAQDVFEGADMVMVKPAVAYLDIISKLNEQLKVPVAAYHVSGEYSMIKAAALNNWIDEKNVVLETLTAIKRAGANLIFSYYAKDVLKWLSKNH